MLRSKKLKKCVRRKTKESVIKYDKLDESDVSQYKYFNQFPLQKPTLAALKFNGFTKVTKIQKLAMLPILLGKDVVAEAETGSGKTLAYLVPLLDRLFTSHVTTFDGPVAIILTPTRELARQIVMVLKKFHSFFKFTVLNIMGGKTSVSKRQEWNSVARANIIVGTPGRLAQHQTENPLMDLSNLQTLVFDEADRLLDPTFKSDVDTILTNLSPMRQTLLFSATQNNTHSQLARLSVRSPVVVSTRQAEVGALPDKLLQTYAVVPLDQKPDILWTFLQSHCKKKIIVFFSTQKQVRYTYELFQQLRPYFRVMQLRGNMHQHRRFQVYDRFSATPHGCVLLATNLAERGLDFPSVDWVVQYDCPGQLDDYVHRVGRTARYGHAGRSIMFLMPSETALVDVLAQQGVTLHMQKFPVNQIKRVVSQRASSILASKPDLAVAARAAFTAYLRDYCLLAGSPAKQPNGGGPRIFDPSLLPVAAFSTSLGLPSIPELPTRFLQWINQQVEVGISESTGSKANHSSLPLETCTTVWTGGPMDASSNDEGSVENFLIRKPTYASELRSVSQDSCRQLLDVVDESAESEAEPHPEADTTLSTMPSGKKKPSRIRLAKSQLRKNIRLHRKTVFDERGEEPADVSKVDTSQLTLSGPLDMDAERARLREITDKEDRRLWKERRLEQNRLRRKKIKEARKQLQQRLTVGVADLSDDEEDSRPAEKVPRLVE